MKLSIREWTVVAVAVLVSCILFGLNSWYVRSHTLKLATIDIKAALQAKQKQVGAQLIKPGVTAEDRNSALQSAAAYPQKVETALNDIIASCHCILISKDMVVNGPTVEDHTSGLLEHLKGELEAQ